MPKIFVSYRREDDASAGRLGDELVRVFGQENVVMGVENIPPGTDVVEHLVHELFRSDAMLVVIGPRWAEARDEAGNRRLDDPNDHVAMAIETALFRNIRVIPVLIGETKIPSVFSLPRELQPLADLNALSLRHNNFQQDIDRLIRQLFALSEFHSSAGSAIALDEVIYHFNEPRWPSLLSNLVSLAKWTGLILMLALATLVASRVLSDFDGIWTIVPILGILVYLAWTTIIPILRPRMRRRHPDSATPFEKYESPEYHRGVIGHQKVMFATNRQIHCEDGSLDLEKVTFHWQPWLHYGRAWITIPESHRLGEVERPKRKWQSLWLLKEQEDPAKHFTFAELLKVDESSFFAELSDAPKKSALVFVHGFNVSLTDAIFRAAQIGFDSNFVGEIVAFCWASKAKASPEAYDYDREKALASHHSLLKLLQDLRRAGMEQIFVVAHSLGSQIVVNALSLVQTTPPNFKLEEVVFGAPDVDRDVFVSSAAFVKAAADGVTIYASSADKALIVSRIKAGGVPRAGDVPPGGPLLVPGMDVIDVTAVGEDMFALNHTVFAEQRSVLDDLGRIVISRTRPPHVRSPTLKPMPRTWKKTPSGPEPDYWRYPH